MFKKLLLIIFFCFVPVLYAENFVSGKDYITIEENSAQKNLVVEYFSYGCNGCYQLEPKLQEWHKTHSEVKLERIPVVFNKDWQTLAKAFYVIKSENLEHQLTPVIFKAVLVDKKRLNSDEAMVSFLKDQKVNDSVLQSAFYHSPSMELNLKQSVDLMIKNKIMSIPAVVINGKYKTDLQMAQNPERFFAIIDYLLAQD